MSVSEPPKDVLCLGLSPALQRTVILEGLALGEVNRASRVVESAGGKSVTTARALATLGSTALAGGFNGGPTGEQLISLMASEGLGTQALTSMAPSTRICSTLVDRATGTATELVEEAPDPGSAAVARFVRDNVTRVRHVAMCLRGSPGRPWTSTVAS